MELQLKDISEPIENIESYLELENNLRAIHDSLIKPYEA